MKSDFLELFYLKKVIRKLSLLGSMFQCEILDEVRVKNKVFPIYGLRIGPDDPSLPVLGLFGGVHGLEKIGTHIIANYLNALANELSWNSSLAKNLETSRVISIPLVNPGGMFLNYRSNPNGVDLMRNAPVQSMDRSSSIISGQSWTRLLPWFRGNPENMERENKALEKFIKTHMFNAPFSMSLDIHSGFGLMDRLWYPYGKTVRPFPDERLTCQVGRHLKISHPFHSYKVERQSDSYLIKGDVWDYLYDEFKKYHKNDSSNQTSGHVPKFLPWTLEIGSWSWLICRPHQIFSVTGLFHTNDSKKYAFIMKKHWALLDFFKNMTIHYKSWI